MSFEAAGPTGAAKRREIAGLRTRVLAHWLGCYDRTVDDETARAGAIGAAVEALRNAGYVSIDQLGDSVWQRLLVRSALRPEWLRPD